MKKHSIPFLGAAALLVACADDARTPPVVAPPAEASIHGTLQGADQLDLTDVRVALVWFAELTTAQGRHLIAQEATVLEFTPQLRLAITEPPPAGAVHYELGYSQGKIVAYRDKNHNQKLDFTALDATEFVDEIVAYHPHLTLWSTDDGGLKLTLPGSPAMVDPSSPITLLERSEPRSSCHLLEWTPRSAFTARRQSFPDPDEGDQGPWDIESVQFPQCVDSAPPAEATRVACDSATAQVFYASWSTGTSNFVAETCGQVMRTCKQTQGNTPPEDWACPCDPDKYGCVTFMLEL